MEDNFITKLDPAGAIVYSTYLGGNKRETPLRASIIDESGNVYLLGSSNSNNFPTRNAFQTALKGIEEDITVTKLNSAGEMLFSTYYGGSGTEDINKAIIDKLACICFMIFKFQNVHINTE